MFEGLVRQLILGYLGQYIKDIHREQLKITLWKEEVFLENVELILEAFDYLELPFALKQGRVGRLSIRIPWKKLGWDPIIIILEDILVCASQREDEEWSVDEVERRAFAGKKAKLATAELAKLSQRVCDNQTGKSFISYITAKIIDGIQVTIKNVHVVYGDMSNDKSQTVFGLKLASLTAMKQNLVGVASGKVGVGQVNKLVEIQGLEIYCKTFHGSTDNSEEDSMSMVASNSQSDEHVHLLAPVDVSVSLSVNRSGRLENNAAQYSIDIELSGLVLCLNEDQLREILYLHDYLCICRLREKYGRYRPWGRPKPLSERPFGWQIQWWHYAQQSVLSDVRKRMKRSSWKYLGERITRKRRYVKLYKLKLECLRKEELLDDETVMELDQMEKESDIEDILSYRYAAESELQEFLVDSASEVGATEAIISVDKSMDDDQKPQGWLKWLSRGMLGAGGTDDSSQFSGVVSDEVIKDIYEATKFHLAPSPVLDTTGSDGILLSSIKCSINQISATLRNKKFDCAIAEVAFEGNLVECMIWEESAVVTVSIDAVQMINPLNEQVILLVKRVISEENTLEVGKPSLNIQAYIPNTNLEGEMTLKVQLEPIEVTCDPTYFVNFTEIDKVLNSFQSHEERVLNSLNGIDDVKSRLISKAKYVLSGRKRMMWDISLINIKIIIPWENKKSELHKLVIELKAVNLTSKRDIACYAPDINLPSLFMKNLVDNELLEVTQIQDLYDLMEIEVIDFQINLIVPFYPYTLPILEKLNASLAVGRCIFQDESLLKALEVYVKVAMILAHLSPSIICSVLELVDTINTLLPATSSDKNTAKNFSTFCVSAIANLESASIILDLENDCTLTVSLQDLDMRFVLMEPSKDVSLSTKGIKVTSCLLKSGDDLVICLSESNFSTPSSPPHHEPNGCLMFHYDGDLVNDRCSIRLTDFDLHCYPYVIGLLVDFFDKLSEYGSSNPVKSQVGSNSIPVDHYPFVTIHNDRSLLSLEGSLINTSKIDSLKSRAKKEFQKLPDSDEVGLVVINVDLSSIRLHFHDSSCIVASVTLPAAKSCIAIHENFMDVLCSTEGLNLSSYWFPQTLQDSLWGPGLSNLSPVINIRVKKENLGSTSFIELGLSIQKVSCVLPPDFLAVLIGYFQLPHWGSSSKEKVNNSVSLTFKLEILDSVLFTPVGNADYQFIKLNIPQMYCTFIEKIDSDTILKEIPSECCVLPEFLADQSLSLNIFGRDLSLHHLMRKDEFSEVKNVSLIDSVSADIWMRIPYVSNPTPPCATAIMLRVNNCQIIVEGSEMLLCFEALVDVIDQYTSVENLSMCFTSDVSQFLELKRNFQETRLVPIESSSSVSFTEIKCSVQSMSVELVGSQVDIKLTCGASLKNETLLCLNMAFASLTFSSLSDVLMECTSCSQNVPVLEMKLLISEKGENHLRFSLPCLNIWLFLSKWNKVVDFLKSCVDQLPKTEEPEKFTSEPVSGVNTAENSPQSISVASYISSDDIIQNRFSLTVKSDHIGVKIRIPVQISGEALKYFGAPQVQEQSSLIQDNCSFLFIYLQSRSTEVNIDGQKVNFKSNLGRTKGSVELCQNKSVHSWPLFQLLQVDLEADFGNDDLKTEIHCDNLDVWLSHHTFYFWQTMLFVSPEETESSQFPIGSLSFKFHLGKLSVLLTDQKWCSNGPLLEILMESLMFHGVITSNLMEGSVESELQVNYNNIHKVLWEPFLEPWKFKLILRREQGKTALQNSPVMTDVHLDSSKNLNINITESFIEVAFRTFDMIKDAYDLMGLNLVTENSTLTEAVTNRYTPYTLENLTSLPLVFYISRGSKTGKGFDLLKDGKHVEPGGSYPVYIDDKQIFGFKTSQSSDNLGDRQDAQHHYIVVQLEGTSTLSTPVSIDLVGVSYFEVDFSNSVDSAKAYDGYVVPVVIDVSVQRYTKLVRLYSTVILTNATSIPFEVRFDIPFGVSPKILDPVYPGHEFPLPLHLAESGRIRWRPLGSTYLWSEAYSISNILKLGYLRSFVCYPSLPSSDPFRSCVSVHDVCLPSAEKVNKVENQDQSSKRFIHLVTLSNPLTVKNYLPVEVTVTIESVGVSRSMLLSEVETCFYHIDSSHDLSLTFDLPGFRPSVLKFPRADKFSEFAKFSGTKFSSLESVNFSSESSKGPLYVTMEKVMDAFSGAREICIFVPFLLYNCCGFPLSIGNELTLHDITLPSCYDLDENDPLLGKKDGLGLLSSNQELQNEGTRRFPLNNNLVSTRKSLDTYHGKFPKGSFTSSGLSTTIHTRSSNKKPEKTLASRSIDFDEMSRKKVNFHMYSPDQNIPSSEIMVRVSRRQSGADVATWSSQFFLVPPAGSTTVLVPRSSTNASYVISVASSAISGPYSGKTRIINFQPRYVISNACSKDLCYRQKGSDYIYHLKGGQHSHIHWTDITRELLVSVRFDEPGWQWSGCFFPEHLGDTQLKMRNYVTGAVSMVRVEVQNADDAIRDEKVVGSDSGTNLILLSDDDTGFMPYRIDNFSKERLRIYQQKCEAFETVIHSYTSCPYAWDEPCYPHRLTVEVFAERVIGSFTLDDAKEYKPVVLPPTSEKPERRLLISVHAEGALKVLSIIDSSYHIFDDIKTQTHSPKYDQKQETSLLYKERLSVNIPFIGISVMSSQPQELLFACARNTMIDLVQSLDQQKFSLKIFALQIDNQLPSTPYPVILSFDHEYKQIQTSQNKIKENSREPVFSLAAAKWRNKDRALLSFEYINLRMTAFHLELEQDVILSLFDFFKTVSSRFHSREMPHMDSVLHTLSSNFTVNKASKFSDTHQSEKTDVDNESFPLLPSIVPIGAPWQKIYLLARKQKKIYVELLEVAPITLTLSFSSSPWMLRNGILTSGEYLIHRGLMALADVEGARIHLGRLTISHQLASLESIREILIIHYTRQLLHEMYKVFGSAGVIGNPMGFARSVGLGIKDFLSVPARSFMQSPAGLITGMAQGTTSLLSNTVYAISDAATQVSRAAHKGIVAFTMDDPGTSEMERQQKGMSSHGKGVINEVLEGLTGLLQSPIRGAEKHGLPGVLSGIALGVTGLVARPAASILEVTEKTARSIRNRSKLYHMGSQHLRVRLPRPLTRDYPLTPYSWEEAVGVSVLSDSDETLTLKDETLVLSKSLKQGGKFVIVTERLILIVTCSSLVNLGQPDFLGVPVDLEWVIEAEIKLDSVIHVDMDEEVVHIVGSSSDVVVRERGGGGKRRLYNPPTPLPLFQTNLECVGKEAAAEVLRVLMATIERGKERGWGCVYRLHQSNVK